MPDHIPPVIDGVLDAGEWDRATTVSMSDGSSIYSMSSGETLYLAVETDRVGAVNLALATEEELWILHSSAALGSALYLPGATTWELSHGFNWCCRISTDDSARQSLLENEGWQANIGFEGDAGVVEYQVELPWIGAAIAISFVTDADTEAFWPTDLSASAQKQLVGPRQSEVDFRLNEWYPAAPLDS